MGYSQYFVSAFNEVMKFEIGAFFDPSDPDVILGSLVTNAQRKNVGYVNIPADRGGETKYGIARNSHPDVNVRTLDLNGAMEIYYDEYWLLGNCDKLKNPIFLIHFDGCVNHGIGRSNKFLQQAVGVNADGQIGPMTIGAIEKADPREVINNISQIRTNFYNSIVQRNPSQKIFLAGWLRRISEVTAFTLSNLN